jgi:hypothetical protein
MPKSGNKGKQHVQGTVDASAGASSGRFAEPVRRKPQ